MLPSKLIEIFEIQLQFLKMQGTLRSFAKFVPESVAKLHLQTHNQAEGSAVGTPTLSLRSNAAQVELKVVTVFFSDIKSFTALCEAIAPKDMCLLLNEYFEAMCVIVEHLGGTIIEFIGDAMLVVWNVPHAVSNHAELCVRFAIEAQAELTELRSIWSERGLPKVEVRMGIHTGLVYAGILGSAARLKYGLLGDSLNVASYLEEANKKYSTNILLSGAAVNAIKVYQDHTNAVRKANEECSGGVPLNKKAIQSCSSSLSTLDGEIDESTDDREFKKSTSNTSVALQSWLNSDDDETVEEAFSRVFQPML